MTATDPSFESIPPRIGLAGPVTLADLLPLLGGAGRDVAWRSTGSPLLTTLVRELLARGHALSVFTCDEALEGRRFAAGQPWCRFEDRAGQLRVYVVPFRVRAYRFQHGRPGRMLDFFARERAALAGAMRADAPALVHAHWSYEYAAAAQASGLPALITCHDSPRAVLRALPDLYRLGRYAMARRVLRRAGRLTVVSPYLVDELAGWTRQAPAVVPNPLPAAVHSLGRRRERVAPSRTPAVVMVLNGWTALKNPVPGLQAMLSLRERFAGTTLHLVGPGFGVGQDAWQWASARGAVDAFQFHGPVLHGRAIKLISRADLLIHPALEESFGLSVAEAMALGVPVVAGERSGAVPWVTGGVAGALVDVRSAPAIADACARLLTDPAAYAAASAAALARADACFSAAAVTQRYLDLYRELLQ